MLLVFVYLNRAFHTRRTNIPAPLFYAAFVLAESVLMANQLLFHNPDKQFSIFVTISLSILSTFALCFLYETTLRRKVIYSIIFQFFAAFSEATFMLIIKLTSPDILKHETPYLVAASFFECTYHLYFSSIFMSSMPINPYNMLISPVIYI